MKNKKHTGCQKTDVLIAGGGLAGLALALQISELPERLSVVILEKDTGLRPEDGFKVGESTVEGGGEYLGRTLGLAEYLDEKHFRKSGPRILLGSGPFARRRIFSAAGFASLPAYQLNRGKLENHLISLLQERGVAVRRGCRVISIDASNRKVRYREINRDEEISASWIIDASGYPGILKEDSPLPDFEQGKVTASWFRVRGHFVPGAKNIELRDLQATTLVPGKERWFWVIPLPGGNTSVGIVQYSKGRTHGEPLSTVERAMEWLASEDPQFVEELKLHEVLDFQYRGDLSYVRGSLAAAPFVFRTGDARGFADPMYSPGIDFVALANNMILDRIATGDSSGKMPDGYEELYRQFFTQFYRSCRTNYTVFQVPELFMKKLYWDTLFYWNTLFPVLRYRLYENMNDAIDPELKRMIELDDRVQKAFREKVKDYTESREGRSGYFPPPGSVLTEALRHLVPPEPSHFSFQKSLRLLERLESFATGEPEQDEDSNRKDRDVDRFRMELRYLEGKMELDHYLMIQRLFQFT